jgi:signal transduction histidine kinase
MPFDEHFLLSVLERSPLATAIYDSADLNIAFANQAMLDTWHASSSILGHTLCACFPSFEKDGFSSILKNVWKTGITYRAKDTPADILSGRIIIKRYFDFEYKALLDEKGNTYAILHSSWDVTERKLAYDKAESQKEQISFNRKLDLLSNTLSHDLKNPLSILKMGNDMLRKNISLPEHVQQKWFDNMQAAIENIQSIINQTLQLNKIRAVNPVRECLDMDKKIAEWIDEVKLLYPASQLEFRLGNLYKLEVACSVAYQIFFNLISNAVKYAKDTEQDYLAIYSEKTSKGIVYYLEDNGIGIPDEDLDVVFKAHERAKNALAAQGSGIGLSLVKELVERLDGNVNLSSKLGKGTIIRLFFPNN